MNVGRLSDRLYGFLCYHVEAEDLMKKVFDIFGFFLINVNEEDTNLD